MSEEAGFAPSTLEKLRQFLETARMKEKMGPHAFADFEKELHERMMEAERAILAAEMAQLDVDADAIVIDGKIHRCVLRQSQTYTTSAGEVVVERTLYKECFTIRGPRERRAYPSLFRLTTTPADRWPTA